MKNIIATLALCLVTLTGASAAGALTPANDTGSVAGKDTILINTFSLDEVTVTSFYLNGTSSTMTLDTKRLTATNTGQEPSHLFKHMPGIYAMSDNGTEYGYGYYRIRGLDQTRINVMLDGMPWNEAEDFGSYFANSPDLMSSMHDMTVQRGTSSRTSGVSASAGSILLESVDLYKDTVSHADLVYGHYNTHKASIVYNMGDRKGWGFHLKVTQSGTDGYRNDSQNMSHAATMKVGYRFGNGMTVDFLTMNGYHTNGQGWIGSYREELEANPRANGNLSTETDNWFQTIDKLQFKGWITDRTMMTASAYIQYQTGSYRMDLDNYMWRMADPAWEETGKLYNYGLTHYLYGANVFVKDNTVDFMEISAGVNAYGFDRRHFMDTSNPDRVANLDENDMYDNTGHKIDISASLAMDFHVTRGLTLGFNLQYRHAGFSYTEGGRTYTSGHILTYDGEEGAVTDHVTKDTRWDFLNGGIALRYDFNHSHQIYASLAVSNREPTRSTMVGGNEYATFGTFGGVTLPVYTTVNPELVHDVEVGYNVGTDVVTANINAFYMKFKDELVLTGTYGENGLPMHVNAHNSFRTGIEVSIDYMPVSGLHLVNRTSWSKNLVKLSETDSVYRQHVLTPEWTLDQDIHYDWRFVTIGCVFNLHSEMYTDMENTEKYRLPVNMTLGAYATARFFKERLIVDVRLNNLTNRVNYYNGCAGATGEMLYFQEARFNMLCSMKFMF